MKVSILQMPIDKGNIEHNLDAMSAMLEETMNSSNRPDAVLLPELWNTGFYPSPSVNLLTARIIGKTTWGALLQNTPSILLPVL